MKLKTLDAWINYIGTVSAMSMDLGLERVREVASRMDLLHPSCPVITIAGTNGKGSTLAGLEAIYMAQGYKVGAFTSPYLFRLNEEVRIQGVDVDDDTLCRAFEQVEAVRGDVRLTPFEFNTLAALEIFREARLDVILLEVGLGGRLDAVNIIDADLGVVTSIAIDHAEWLGHTRELIGREKAGIFRANTPAVCGDLAAPSSLINYAAELGAPLYCQNRDFSFSTEDSSWGWQSENKDYKKLPLPSLALQNMSSVLMAVELMQSKLAVTPKAIKQGLEQVKLPGRIQVFPGKVTRIFDVSHNPAAAKFLAQKLETLPCQGKTRAVFSMLVDKDIVGTIQVMKNYIDDWYIAELPVQRGTNIEILQETFRKAEVPEVHTLPDIALAYQSAIDDSQNGDRVIVFGSFYAVAGVMTQML